jgi:hypothetical protein
MNQRTVGGLYRTGRGKGAHAAPSPHTPLPGSKPIGLTNADHLPMIRTVQRRFAPTATTKGR